ncbi:MAG: 2,3-bisphosphoglycerate-independent phosphoglycerate mutase, partial [Patescibacteria group bacterium]
MEYLKKNYPFFLLQASGRAVGLPPLKEGNSEVGHLTIGAGRIVLQHLTEIDESIKNRSFFENETFVRLLNHAQKNNSRIHLAGLLTSGTVHASLEHLIEIIKFIRRRDWPNPVFLHLFTDGKDSGKKESPALVENVEKEISGSRIKLASLIGRDFAMDRDNNWDLTQKAYDLLVFGRGEKTDDFKKTLTESHLKGISDEMIPPILKDDKQKIEDGDGVFFLNFREDSIRQLARSLVKEEFNFFETKKFKNLFLATMTDYENGLNAKPVFKRREIKNTLAEVLEKNGLKQLHIAETAKYAHLTYFFNGLRENKFENETDLFISSFENPIERPEMKAGEITEKILEELARPDFEFVAANFANPDM